MSKARKLPSGSWRCQVYSHTEEIPQPDGTTKKKRIYKSFTCDDASAKGKRKCEQMAAQWAVEKENEKKSETAVKFSHAMKNYISSKENVLSPSTIRGYNSQQRTLLRLYPEFCDTELSKITQEQVQKLINDYSTSHSPKTVKNVHGFISAVLTTYQQMNLNTTLPQKEIKELYIPTDADVKKLISAISDDEDLLIAVLLAAFGPMRRSEICGLLDTDFQGNIAHVNHALVLNSNNEWVRKLTKSDAGNRLIPFPDFVYDRIKDRKGRIVNLNPTVISKRFKRYLKVAGLPDFRFHDLRHYSASIQHALGVPDAYIMQRGGWSTDGVLKQIYRHALSDQSIKMNNKINEHFTDLCNTKCNTKQKKP